MFKIINNNIKKVLYMKDKLTLKLEEAWKVMETTSSMPPGFENLVGDLDELPSEEEFNGVGISESALDDAPTRDIDPMDIAKSKTKNPNIAQGIDDIRTSTASKDLMKKKGITPDQKAAAKAAAKANEPEGKYLPAERPQRLIHSSALLGVLTPEGNEIDKEKFKKLITVRPEQIVQQNSKLASSGSGANEVFYDLTLPAYQGLFYNEREGKFQVVKTCPSAGACKAYCYATSGGYVQYEGPWLSSTRTINFLMNDYEGFKQKVLQELQAAVNKNKKENKKVVLRWHDAGDFFSATYLLMAFDIARSTPEVRHYAYTKQVELVKQYLDKKPENFIFNYSKGGTQDSKVDFNSQKHSKVVPYVLFKDLKVVKGEPLSPEDTAKIKERVAHHYSLNPESVITYDELVKMPVNSIKSKYNVIVRPGDGDDAAAREDVLGTYLLIH
jgi:hypothetical protein